MPGQIQLIIVSSHPRPYQETRFPRLRVHLGVEGSLFRPLLRRCSCTGNDRQIPSFRDRYYLQGW